MVERLILGAWRAYHTLNYLMLKKNKSKKMPPDTTVTLKIADNKKTADVGKLCSAEGEDLGQSRVLPVNQNVERDACSKDCDKPIAKLVNAATDPIIVHVNQFSALDTEGEDVNQLHMEEIADKREIEEGEISKGNQVDSMASSVKDLNQAEKFTKDTTSAGAAKFKLQKELHSLGRNNLQLRSRRTDFQKKNANGSNPINIHK
ncbi:hypothetical protein KFK09_011362 [Dendrobium nobile]|uniref:Uncharacterized protein n=1 Tax=Dendrobium nobile TaxID=94219 RepID=A0A8T3BEE4_DENNO|nr:hypothetical protein KFK09_011362 [Dendrobium nobile]